MELLIKAANRAIDRVLAVYHRPALMCSFGKDSMVLLHLLRARGIRLPVIFHRDPWWPEKYAFADRIIREWDLEVHDWAPLRITLWEGKAIMAFTNHYQVGPLPGGTLQLPKNILPPVPGQRYLCGLRDVLQRPTGTFNYPWDCVLIGHKSSDEDQIAGKVPLRCDIKQNAGIGPDAAFPLRGWADADIWGYSAANGVPQQRDRYAEDGSELEDKRFNSDYAHVCIACCDRRQTAVAVQCPKFDCQVSTVAVPYEKPEFSYYGEQKP
jgi:3'-phosphoadenosine 5'-phosphosulfate sulfotransferase (PAPS reductase)/FAD synthetase